VEPDPPPEPEVLFTDDWEIGIPDDGAIPEPPVQESIARVGQVGVEPPVFTAKVVPQYPRLGMQVKVEGYVILEAILRKDGHIDDIKVLRPLAKGKLGFEEEAIKALKKWKFLPGKVNERPADVRMTLKVDFQLARGVSAGN
jgi:protein TonB